MFFVGGVLMRKKRYFNPDVTFYLEYCKDVLDSSGNEMYMVDGDNGQYFNDFFDTLV